MPANPQFNYVQIRPEGFTRTDPVGRVTELVELLNRRFRDLATAVRGPVALSATANASKTLSLTTGDLTTVTVTANVTLTLDRATTRPGASAYLEIAQDATGGRTVTFVNVANTPPSIATTANQRTLLLAVNTPTGWVLSSLASGY